MSDLVHKPNPRCKHGMYIRFCAVCTPPEPQTLRASPGHRVRLSLPTPRETTSVLARALGAKEYNYVVVRTSNCNRVKISPTFSELSSRTTKVHVAGFPFLWAVEEILRRAPNLKCFQVIPTQLRHMSSAHMGLLQARGVEVVTGHDRPEMAWGDGDVRVSKTYHVLRKMLLASPEKRAVLDELEGLGFEAAGFVKRYLCLNGEEYAPYRMLSEQFGIYATHDALASAYVYAVIKYLYTEYEVNERSTQLERAMRPRVEKARALAASTAHMADTLKRLGLVEWPKGLSLSRADEFEYVLGVWRSGGFSQLSDREVAVLVQRFGLEGKPVPTLYDVELPGGVRLSRERIRQIEVEALSKIGLKGDE